ncbi:unnamed protein product [Sphagnum compactum]
MQKSHFSTPPSSLSFSLLPHRRCGEQTSVFSDRADRQPLTEEEGSCFCVCLMMAGLLEKLWDDVLAGPQPDKGLKKLRKKTMLSPDSALPGGTEEYIKRTMNRQVYGEFETGENGARSVGQAIPIKKPPMMRPLDIDSPVASPGNSWSSPPASPSTPTPGNSGFIEHSFWCCEGWRNVFSHRSNRAMEGVSSEKFEEASLNSPTVHDWVVISVLDR